MDDDVASIIRQPLRRGGGRAHLQLRPRRRPTVHPPLGAALAGPCRLRGRCLHSSTFQLNLTRWRSNNPRTTWTHHQLIMGQQSARAYTRPLLSST